MARNFLNLIVTFLVTVGFTACSENAEQVDNRQRNVAPTKAKDVGNGDLKGNVAAGDALPEAAPEKAQLESSASEEALEEVPSEATEEEAPATEVEEEVAAEEVVEDTKIEAPAAAPEPEPAPEVTAEEAPEEVEPEIEKSSFAGDIMPFFKSSCVDCHNAENANGGVDLSTAEELKNNFDAAADSIVIGYMPMGDAPKLNAEQIKALENWANDGYNP